MAADVAGKMVVGKVLAGKVVVGMVLAGKVVVGMVNVDRAAAGKVEEGMPEGYSLREQDWDKGEGLQSHLSPEEETCFNKNSC